MTDIKTLLPHREPFLFVDRIEKADAEEIVGYKRSKATVRQSGSPAKRMSEKSLPLKRNGSPS